MPGGCATNSQCSITSPTLAIEMVPLPFLSSNPVAGKVTLLFTVFILLRTSPKNLAKLKKEEEEEEAKRKIGFVAPLEDWRSFRFGLRRSLPLRCRETEVF